MLHSAYCKVNIRNNGNCNFYTDGDKVVGDVELDVKRDINIVSIEAQLKCEDRGRVYFTENEEIVDLSAAHFDDTEVLWSSPTITFDVDTINGILKKGFYQFPFEFNLPENAQKLPSSFNFEPEHDFNGISWGIHALVDRDNRIRQNYHGVAEIRMLPRRYRAITDGDSLYETTDRKTNITIHRRPSFLVRQKEKNQIEVEAQLSVLNDGLTQIREQVPKDRLDFPEVRISVRSPEANMVVVKEVILFIDTTIKTQIKGRQGMSKSTAIIVDRDCNETITGGSHWQDLSHIITGVHICGLPETWKSNIHEIQHTLRVQFELAPVIRATRTSLLEISSPVKLHSESTVIVPHSSPPPKYSE